jgi:hypothetical protein
MALRRAVGGASTCGMSDQRTVAGGCHCGRVRFTATGDPLNVRICHCGSCRKASGGLMYGRAVYRAEALERRGKTVTYPSSSRLLRHFCPQCGSMVYSQPLDRPDCWSVGLAALDDPDALPPDMHIWVSAKPAWLKLDDGLPQYPERGPAW